MKLPKNLERLERLRKMKELARNKLEELKNKKLPKNSSPKSTGEIFVEALKRGLEKSEKRRKQEETEKEVLQDYINKEKFPLTSQEGLSVEDQILIDGFNLNQGLLAKENGEELDMEQQQILKELLEKREFLKINR